MFSVYNTFGKSFISIEISKKDQIIKSKDDELKKSKEEMKKKDEELENLRKEIQELIKQRNKSNEVECTSSSSSSFFCLPSDSGMKQNSDVKTPSSQKGIFCLLYLIICLFNFFFKIQFIYL